MSPNQRVSIAALVSVGQHPRSSRARRAEQDARAVELGLRTAGDGLRLIHVGKAEEEALRQYLGMGIPRITVLPGDPDADAVPALVAHLEKVPVDVILTGVHAERGEASGFVPYILAERLGRPLVPRLADIRRIGDGTAEVLQALPRGQRRALRVPLPFVATVDNAAAAPRQYAYGPGRRGTLSPETDTAPTDDARTAWRVGPAKPRPKRLNVVKGKSAADRFKAATAKSQNTGGRLVREGTDKDKAQAIMELLVSEGVVR